MKKMVLLMMAGLVAVSSVPAFAANAGGKDECLLISKNCKDQVDSIQQKIQRIQNEIKKGTRVYTPAELKKLHAKLKEANQILEDLNRPGK